ncbi:kinase-like domain-containing protein [Thelonectria olida]|uniref:Kinase-like domain-containing protein n=1 Tax=Thelonectria olida TaxID=1576542 RepID=A0A9P9AKE2_9HYPO|nr:kinase-like domain-containing protein [Thelonectria olida]
MNARVMAAPAQTTDSHLWKRLDGLLHRNDEASQRLETWAGRQETADAPLTALLCKQIKTLATQIHKLKAEAEAFCLNTDNGVPPDYVAPLPNSLELALHHAKLRLSKTLELLDFHMKEKRRGPDGALNALFASKFILHYNNHYDPGASSYWNEDKLLRVGLEMKGLANELVHGSDPGRIEPLWARMIDCYEQFRPRYVHTYETLAETPYLVDSAGKVFSGSSGVVQKVIHRRRREALAMKTFPNVFAAKDVTKILREVGILEVSSHKNIVRLIECFRTEDEDQSLHLVMAPWAPYTVLNFLHSSDIARGKRCPWFKVGTSKSDSCIYRIMYELADAVGYLHSLSIKHKDLKPENILLHGEGGDQITPLVTDVGVSKIYVPGGPTNYKDSTYEYLAPEQHEMKESTLKSDVWQLGCCFAELLALAKGGTRAVETLHDSFIRDEEDCACSIATEHDYFMKALAKICLPGNSAQKRAYATVAGMLDPNPLNRINIQVVQGAMAKLPGIRT